MRLHPLTAVVLGAGVLALGLPAAAQAAPTEPSFTVRGELTSKTELRGTITFTQPSGWKKTAGGNRHSYVSYRVVAGDCRLDLIASVRSKATSQSMQAQVDGWAGDSPLGSGTRPGGVWGTDGPVLRGGEGEPLTTGVYGIASIRVADKRYAQLTIRGLVRGCESDSADAEALLDPKGSTVRRVNHILKTAKTSLRVVRVK